MSDDNNIIHTFEGESIPFLNSIAGGQSQKTIQTYGQGLSYFWSYLEQNHHWTPERPISDLHSDMIQQFPAWLVKQTYTKSKQNKPSPLSETSRSTYLIAVSRFIRFLVIFKRVPLFDYAEYEKVHEWFKSATHVKEAPVEQKTPPDGMVEALIEAARTAPQLKPDTPAVVRHREILSWRRDLAIILSLKSSGMRVGELTALKRKDLDYERKGAWVEGKGRKKRFVVFDDEAWTAIQIYLEERADENVSGQIMEKPLFCRHDRAINLEKREAISVRHVQRLIEKLSAKANVANRFNMSPHSLRHHFATSLLKFTGNLALVQIALGHSEPRTTTTYAKVHTAEVADRVRAMSKAKRRKKNGEEEQD